MRLNFFGAAGGVTGSCYLLEAGGAKILIECGMLQGVDAKRGLPEDRFPFNPEEINVLLLTHAHIDHSGRIPLLVKKGFRGKIICTDATADLCSIMLPDSGHIQEAEAEWENRKRQRAGRPLIKPLYTSKDALDCQKFFSPVGYHEQIEISKGVRANFVDAGHLLGSASIEVVCIDDGGHMTNIVFSGDIGRANRPILRDPEYIQEADYVLCESTYGDRLHETKGRLIDQLAQVLGETIDRRGNVVVPAFAIGRTQEILYDINRLLEEKRVPGLEKVPVFIDSPLAIEGTEVFMRNYLSCYDDEAVRMIQAGDNPFEFPTLRTAQTVQESMAINFAQGTNIIISASGMCEAGRIRHHLKHNLWRADSTILFVGYQAEGTLGRKLLDGEKKVMLFGEEIGVHARIAQIEGYSGHADRDDLIKWLGAYKTPPKKIFIIHGEDAVRETFHALVRQKYGYDCEIPKLGDAYELVLGESRYISSLGPFEKRGAEKVAHTLRESFSNLSMLVREGESRLAGGGNGEAENLSRLAEEMEGLYNKWQGAFKEEVLPKNDPDKK